MGGLKKYLIQMEEHVSDYVMLQLSYYSTTKNVISLDISDIRSLSVIVMFFSIILLSYKINSSTSG